MHCPSFIIHYNVGDGIGLCGCFLAGDAYGDDYDRSVHTVRAERNFTDPWRNVSPSMSFIPGGGHVAWVVSGKLFFDPYFWKGNISFIPNQASSASAPGRFTDVDHVGNADRMYIGKLC